MPSACWTSSGRCVSRARARSEHLNIAKDTIVSLDVELSDIWGELIQRSEEPLQYLHGGYGNIFPAAEAALEGKRAQDRIEVRLEPEDAFGDYDENLLRVEPRSRFPEALEVGMRLPAWRSSFPAPWSTCARPPRPRSKAARPTIRSR